MNTKKMLDQLGIDSISQAELDALRACQTENARLRAILSALAEKAQCPWCLAIVGPHGRHCEIAKALGLPQTV